MIHSILPNILFIFSKYNIMKKKFNKKCRNSRLEKVNVWIDHGQTNQIDATISADIWQATFIGCFTFDFRRLSRFDMLHIS